MIQHPLIGLRLQSPSGGRPSSRLRGLLPLAVLRQHGVPAEIYTDNNRSHYKIVVFQKLYNAREQQLAKQLKAQGVIVVLDMCDNIFFNPLHDIVYERKAQDLQKMVDIADIITVSTTELAKYFSHTNVVCIRDGVEEVQKQTTSFRSKIGRTWLQNNKGFRDIVWFGIAEGECGHRLMLQLLKLETLFNELQHDFKLRLSVISNNKRLYKHYVQKLPVPTRYFSWKNTRNAHRLLQAHEICILPIVVDPFTICKTHNRLSLALNAGLGVVADSIPSYKQFSPYCFLDNWEEGLRTYLSNPVLREQHVQKGQTYIKKHYTINHAAIDWWQLFFSILPNDIEEPVSRK